MQAVVLMACSAALAAYPASAAVADVTRHQGKVPWLSKQPRHDFATCKASCKSLGRAAVMLPCSGLTDGAPAGTAGTDCPCHCCAAAEDGSSSQASGTNAVCSLSASDETAWCKRQRHKCKDECGGKEHMNFM